MQEFMTALFECSISMSFLILCMLLLTPLLSKRYAPKWIYYSWLILVIGLILPFRVHLQVTYTEMATSPTNIQTVVPSSIAASAVDTGVMNVRNLPWHLIVSSIWLLGVMMSLLCHSIRHYRFIKMVNRWSEPVMDQQVLDAFHAIRTNLHIPNQVTLIHCPFVSSPMLIGARKPSILLPFCDCSLDELSFILKHELIHYKRRDLWYKCLVLLAVALHWFNPLVYRMAKAIAIQCELSCDAEVMKGSKLKERQKYSETIIGVIKHCSGMRTAFSTNFYKSSEGMKRRIYSIMDCKRKKAGLIICCLLLVGILITSIQLVSVTTTFTYIDDTVAEAVTDNGSLTENKVETMTSITYTTDTLSEADQEVNVTYNSGLH